MSTDYLVASMPTLAFGAPAPISWERFCEMAGDVVPVEWNDIETQLRNAIVEARMGERGESAGGGRADKYRRPAVGCSIYWKNRILACFQEKDVMKRDEMLDRVWWDAAGELTPPASPLGKGALATYAVRLKIALKRAKISADAGNAAFDRLTAETKIS